MFQIGDLVKYDANNRWKAARAERDDGIEKVGIITSVTSFKDDTAQNEVYVQWNGGYQKVYFEEELRLLSQNENENENN